MPRIILAVMLLSLFITDAGASEEARLVTVSGSGEIRVEPDIAIVGVGVEERAPTVDEARRRVNETVQAVLALTRRQGIPQEQVASADEGGSYQVGEIRITGSVTASFELMEP